MAEDYEATYSQADYFGEGPSPLLVKYIDHVSPGARVLDIGAGQGRNALELARRGCRVTALEPSPAGCEAMAEAAKADKLDLEIVPESFLDYEPHGVFNVILCFGLMQILTQRECASLIARLHQWLRGQGTLFLTAWHTEDASFARVAAEWEQRGMRNFRSPGGDKHRLYLEKGEILKLFFRWPVIHHWEGLGPEHRHGDGAPERHGDVEAVLTRP